MLRNLISKFIFIIKKKEFELDENISTHYLIILVFEKIIMLLRGYSYLKLARRGRFFFVGKGTKIKCTSKITVGNGVVIDRNCYLDALSIKGILLKSNTSIGMNSTIICSGTYNNLGVGLEVGSGVGLGTHGFFGCAGGIKIGNNTIFGNFVSMHSENHNFSDTEILIKDQGVNRKGINIGDNCWIGSKVTILDGAVIEDGVIIAAGAVVKGGVYTKNGIYGGVPAKFLKIR